MEKPQSLKAMEKPKKVSLRFKQKIIPKPPHRYDGMEEPESASVTSFARGRMNSDPRTE